jgi:hypothetical protein
MTIYNEPVRMKFKYTNTCQCHDYNPETDAYSPSEECYGDCWYEVVEDFTEITEHLFEKNTTGLWRINEIQLWDGAVSGVAKATNPTELIHAMTVNSQWIIRGEIFNDHIEYSLSHHDAMGSNSSVYIITEEEAERNDWYRY